jgi:NADPH:quinone reductase-like Zn-dependent oxidoreductase
MKASVNFKYGSLEVLQILDVPKPSPNENKILVKIMATTVNRTDRAFELLNILL